MKKLILIILLGISLMKVGYSQIDLAKEIMGVRDSSEIIVRNSRKAINTRLHEHNFTDIVKIIAYTKNAIDKYQYVAFYSWEEQVLSLLAGDLDYFFIVSSNYKTNQYAVRPQEDYLGSYAISLIVDEKGFWQAWYRELNLDNEKKQVVRIMLGALDVFDDDLENRKIVRNFYKNYPKSEYMEFVSQYKNSFISGSFEFEFGGGLWNLKGDLTQLVDPTSAWSFGMGGFWNRFYWSLYFMGPGNSNLLIPIEVTDDNDNKFNMYAGDRLSLINYGLKLGLLAYKSDRIKLYPIAHISGLSLEVPSKNGRNDDNIVINSAFGLGAGLCSDFDILRWNMKDAGSVMSSHLGLRLSAGYQTYMTSKKYLDASGTYCTLSLVWWLGS